MAEKTPMAEETVPIVFKCYPSLSEKLDKARAKTGQSRSKFMRDALVEKLRALGFEISELEANAPDRKGKGGPAKSKASKLRGPTPNGGYIQNRPKHHPNL